MKEISLEKLMAKMQNTDTGQTRRRIITLLKQSGALSAGAMAQDLGLTAMAVRQQLYALEEDGLAAWQSETASGRGRPNKLWMLTDSAQRLFPDAHQDLAVDLITTFRETLGDAAFDALLETRGKKQAAAYQAALADAASLAERTQRLAALRTAEGYMAVVEPLPDGDGWMLIENHCPVCSAARACSGICANELEVFQETFGSAYTVRRTDHILKGARRCAYEIRPGD